jgi:hypothetical protein
MRAMVVRARYDGHADWYDTTFRKLGDQHGSAGLLARLLGPTDSHEPVNAFLAQPGLRLAAVEELDTRMQPWQPDSADGRIIPWNIAITATAVAEPGR